MVRGGPNEEDGRKRIDAAVGGLVWVQRRNGSWWPGQIVGLDELSESSLAPRSGTPIKLLGRDDSTVDWYDLEKPKGVKAFRCGEYDACIEKAQAAAAKSSKRSTKYPRRENAIILALEIERTNLFRDCPDPHSPANDPDGEPVLNSLKHSASISHPSKEDEKTNSDGMTSTCEENSHSTQELSHSGISYEEANGSTYIKGQALKGRRKTPNDSEDDGNEGIKRMKGLDDLGIAAEKKVKVLALANHVKSSASVNHARAGNCMSVGTLANGSCMPTSRRKRSQVIHIHELLKRKYRRRPLTKVLENTTMVPVRIICDEFATPFERSDAITPCNECGDGNNAKDVQLFNRSLPEDDSSDMLFDVPFVNEEQCASGASPIGKPSGPLKSHPGAFRTRSGRNGAAQASTFGHEMVDEPGPTSCATTCMNLKMEKSASKWQSKGKRKARHISKTEEPYSRKKADFNHEKLDAHIIGHENSNGLVNGFTDRRKPTLASSQRPFPYHQQRFLSHLSYEIPDVSPSGIYADSSLYEVEITVEATRPQMQQVPYISLMSKLNGKPITGHPVTVETLEDGYFDPRISDYPASGSCELDDEDAEVMAPTVKPQVRRSKHIKRRSHFSRCRSSRSKRHGPSSKKTRKLSSLTGPYKLNPEKRKPMVQNPKGPMLACVPLKVVFSRINEALNGSTRSAHHASILHNT